MEIFFSFTIASVAYYRFQRAKKKPVRFAAVQASSIFGGVDENVEKFDRLCRVAASKGAKFIVLPECAISGYISQDRKSNWHVSGRELKATFDEGRDPFATAQFSDGPLVQHFAKLSGELNVYITVPFVEKAKTVQKKDVAGYFPYNEWQYFNTIVLVGPEGMVLGHYRKTNLWPYVDFSWATYGRKLCVVDTDYGRVGLGVCFDCHKIMKEYGDTDIWTLLYCIAWVSDKQESVDGWFTEWLPETYLEPFAHYNVIGANWSVDKEQDWVGYGSSTIYAPRGKPLITAQSRLGTEILFADLPRAGMKMAKNNTSRLFVPDTEK